MVTFDNISKDDIKTFVNCPELFEYFFSNTAILFDMGVKENDYKNNTDPNLKHFYTALQNFGAIYDNEDIFVPAGMKFTISKMDSDKYSYFYIVRNNAELEITNIDMLTLTAHLTELGKKVYNLSKKHDINMLKAYEIYMDITGCKSD